MQKPDWEGIEREYRAGQLAIREIARQYGVSEAAIRKRGKKHGWIRDLTDKVSQKIRTDLILAEQATKMKKGKEAEQEIVNAAAARGVAVVREHRQHLGRLARTAERLVCQLELAVMSGNLEEIEKLFGGKESVSDVLLKVANTTRIYVQLERQAFNLDEKGRDEGGGVQYNINLSGDHNKIKLDGDSR